MRVHKIHLKKIHLKKNVYFHMGSFIMFIWRIAHREHRQGSVRHERLTIPNEIRIRIFHQGRGNNARYATIFYRWGKLRKFPVKNATLFPSPTDIYNVSYGGLIKSVLQHQTPSRQRLKRVYEIRQCDEIFAIFSHSLNTYFQRIVYVVFPWKSQAYVCRRGALGVCSPRGLSSIIAS